MLGNEEKTDMAEISSVICDRSEGRKVYLVTGYTDMRKGIDGLVATIDGKYNLDAFSGDMFLFCGHSCHKMKCVFWEGDGFAILYKRFENGALKWPRKSSQARQLSQRELKWLMEGLDIEQPHAIKPGVCRIVY